METISGRAETLKKSARWKLNEIGISIYSKWNIICYFGITDNTAFQINKLHPLMSTHPKTKRITVRTRKCLCLRVGWQSITIVCLEMLGKCRVPRTLKPACDVWWWIVNNTCTREDKSLDVAHNFTTYHVVAQWEKETITSSSERPFYASIKSFTYVIRIRSIHSSNLSGPHSNRDTLWATEYLVQ